MDLSQQACDGQLPDFPLTERVRDSFANIAQGLRQIGVAHFVGASGIGKTTTVQLLARAIVEGEAEETFANARLLVAPVALDAFEAFAALGDALADGAIVVVELDDLLNPIPRASPAETRAFRALGAMLAIRALRLILIGTEWAHDLLDENREVMIRRIDAWDGNVSFHLRVREPSVAPKRLLFKVPLEQARPEMARAVARASSSEEPIQSILDAMVRSVRAHQTIPADAHTTVGIAALLAFEEGFPLRPGHYHRLTIDVDGNRYRMHRETCQDLASFLAD